MLPPRLTATTNMTSLTVTSSQRPRLISPLSLSGLAMAVSIVLVLLYPQQRLSDQIRKDITVDEISLQYIRNLLATEPLNHDLRLQLAQAYASIGQYTNAFATLEPLYTNPQAHWREEATLLKLGILLQLVFAEVPGTPARQQRMMQFSQELHASEAQFSDPTILSRLARLAESGGELELAEILGARLLLTSKNPLDFEDAARRALANGHYLESAQLIWQARQLSNDAGKKISYLKLALSTLQAGGIGHIGLDWIQQLPESDWRSIDVLYQLTKLALASNKPAAAPYYAEKLVGLGNSPSDRPGFNADHYELAYTAFLGNQDLAHALQLAQNAVAQEPDNITWHEHFAHIAEWSGQPKLAIVQWRWLAMHQGKESDWKNWMRLAAGLFDYDAQMIGLERDWKLGGKNEKYVLKIIELYEYLGRPEDALAWLDRNGDDEKHPELILLSAKLLTSMGRDADALTRYRRYLNRETASPELAVTIAALLQRAGLYQEAFDVLMRSQTRAKPEYTLFWKNLGELAWILKQYDAGVIAYQHLSDAADADLNDQIRLFQILKQKDSVLAAKSAEYYWLKNNQIELFMNAVDTYATLKNWNEARRLYQLTETPKFRDYDSNLRFVSLRAEMHKYFGNIAAAENDYRILIKRFPRDMAVKEAYLWLLIDAHKLNQLDVTMQQWKNLLPGAPNLWDVFAAGHLILSRPNQAIILYEQIAKKHTQDDLWLLNYASTLEAVGQIKQAAHIRNQIWQKQKGKQSNKDWLNTSANAKDIEALRLLLVNDPSLGQSVLWKLLRDGSPELKQNNQFIELASLWLNEHDQNDASRTWLIRQYARSITTPK